MLEQANPFLRISTKNEKSQFPVLYSKSLRVPAVETADKINQRKIYLYFTKPIYTGL